MYLPNVDKLEKVADWCELVVACQDSSISKSELAAAIEGEKGDDVEESFVNGVWDELRYRERMYQGAPFSVMSGVVLPKSDWKKVPEYMCCLLFSVYGGTGGLSTSAKEFERVTNEATKMFFGFESVIFGWPVEDGDPKDIETRARILASKVGERFIEPPDRDKKDDTLDVVGWKPFQCGRSSQLVVLIQCASGWHWEGKTRSLRIEAWKQYIHWGCPPVPGLAIADIVPEKKWVDVARDAGLVLDRIRLYNIFVNNLQINSFRTELISWCENQIPLFES